MIYLDALDGSDVLDSHRHGEFAWHYAPRFAFEVARRLRRPAVFEMSTFTHHLWCIRSRYAAWDHPNRSYKRFVDLHCAANEESRRMFLPGELGWWALKGWNGSQTEPTFADDIEYLLAKGLATDTGFALMGIDPKTAAATPGAAAPGRADPALGDTATLGPGARGGQGPAPRAGGRVHARGRPRSRDGRFRPVEYAPHRIEATDERTRTWQVDNRHGPQPLALRIEPLTGGLASTTPPATRCSPTSATPPTSPRGPPQQGVTARWEPVRDVRQDRAGQRPLPPHQPGQRPEGCMGEVREDLRSRRST